MVSLTTFVSLNGEDIHLCKALKQNSGKISFALNIPTDTTNKKYIVVKNHYWEVLDKVGDKADPKKRHRRDDADTAAGDIAPADGAPKGGPKDGPKDASKPTDTKAAAGPKANETAAASVALKDIMGKDSDWLNGDFGIGFGIRYPDANDKAVWTKDVIGMISTDLSSVKWGEYLLTLTELKPAKSDTFKVTFTGFKPEMAFTSYARRDSQSLMLMEQTMSNNKWKARFQEYTMDPTANNWIRVKDQNMNRWKNDSADPMDMLTSARAVLSLALQDVATNYYIKGAFNTYVKSSGFEENGTIVLVENCIESASKYPCPGPVSYQTCTVRDFDPYPTKTTCKRDDLKPLFDCSKWKEDVPTTPGAVRAADVSNATEGVDTSAAPTEPKSEEKKGSGTTILIIVIIIIIIIIILILLAFFCMKSSTKSEDKSGGGGPKAGAVSAKPSKAGSTTGGPKYLFTSSASMGSTTSKMSVRSKVA
ncbi:unnamed protein product [Medioppia subpectinata]|uniref:Uncharacterized protein n=1 Tax=Medioppia subpectinata TaxID=1979941 RepID=A0A7R9Q8D7_9ACAR|nr:unnamed protein product [Medioppia subpectinata]CAG2115734.1 unnamed protein product [Medioppia subpectinata]